jgi:hypothetical protein
VNKRLLLALAGIALCILVGCWIARRLPPVTPQAVEEHRP